VEADIKRAEIDIDKVNAEIDSIVEKENELREAIKKIIEEVEHSGDMSRTV
jgi:type I restriction enzyme M protein